MIQDPTDKHIVFDMYDLVLEFRADLVSYGIPLPEFNKPDVIQMLTFFRNCANGFCKVALNEELHVSGLMVAFLSPSPFNRNYTASQELIWYSRDGKLGMRLFREYEKWAKEKGVTLMSIKCIAPEGEHYDRVSKFYKSKGFFHLESTFGRIN